MKSITNLLITVAAVAGLATGALAGNDTEAKPYVPKFSVSKSEFGHYWIEDQGKRVALFTADKNKQGVENYQVGLFRQYPGQNLDEKSIADNSICDYLAMPGLRLSTNWIGAKAMKGVPGEMKIDTSDPAQVQIALTWKKSAEEFGTQTMRIVYDSELRRYAVRMLDDLQLSQPGGGEYCNFYAYALGDFRPWKTRYDRLLYHDGDDGGGLKAHWLSVRVPQPGAIHLPAKDGMVGYVDEKDGNPVVVIEESIPRTHDEICLSWFDSHLTWDDATGGRKARPGAEAVSGPPYRYHVKFKAYWLTGEETQALLAKTKTVSLAPYADAFKDVLPVKMNAVNDFEHLADFEKGDVKHIYLRSHSNKGGGVTYDTTTGHSGACSLRMTSTAEKGVVMAPDGPELNVTPGRQLKISAWVKTSDVTGDGFYLESGFQGWAPEGVQQFGPKYSSTKLTGSNDWMLLELPMPLTPAQTEFLGPGRITFKLAGTGTVWVDDFVFSEQDAGKATGSDPHVAQP